MKCHQVRCWWSLVSVTSSLFHQQATTNADYTNVAFGKPTKQKGTGWGGLSRFAVDGNKNSYYLAYSCTHTAGERDNWWMVDLLTSYRVHHIKIMNRDSSNQRLGDFTIYVADVNPLPISGAQFIGQKCMTYSGTVPVSGPHTFNCDQSITGRYVYIWKPARDHLTLCEFEVMVPDDSLISSIKTGKYISIDNKKSVLSTFMSTTINEPSRLGCIYECLASSSGVATIIQLDMQTGRCECIQNSRLETPNPGTTTATGWVYLDDVTN